MNFESNILNQINKELRREYDDKKYLKRLLGFSPEQKKSFIKHRKEIAEKILELSLNFEDLLDDMHGFYALFGVFYELFIKTCLLNLDWSGYLEQYLKAVKINQRKKSKNKFLIKHITSFMNRIKPSGQLHKKSLKYANDMLLKKLRSMRKINKEQHKIFTALAEYIIIQRNNFVHSNPRGHDYAHIKEDIESMISKLNKLSNIKLNEKLIKQLKCLPDLRGSISLISKEPTK